MFDGSALVGTFQHGSDFGLEAEALLKIGLGHVATSILRAEIALNCSIVSASMTLSHADRVAAVARQVVSRPAGAKITIRKNTPGHSIRDQAYKRGLHSVDVSALDQILEIDTERRLVRTEAQVTMGELAAATLAQGFVPAVVPEYRKFTVSGLINGEGIQSSSHRYGIFTNTLESVELVTAAGGRRRSVENGEHRALRGPARIARHARHRRRPRRSGLYRRSRS